MNTAEDELISFSPGMYGNPHIDQADAGTVVVMTHDHSWGE